MSWQPISTCPVDTRVMLYFKGLNGLVTLGINQQKSYHGRSKTLGWKASIYPANKWEGVYAPSAWMPVPVEPEVLP